MDKYFISVLEDRVLEKTSEVTLHFTYDKNLTLKELTEVLDMINKAINDFNRDNGIKSGNTLSKRYAAEVAGIKEGSLIIELLVSFAAGITTSVLGNYIFERLKKWGSKKKERPEGNPAELGVDDVPAKFPISITVNGGTVNIHIHNENAA